MQNNKNNITLSLENIISFFRNITSHFTGKAKIITLVSITIMLSFVNITFTSALSYQSNVGVGFTFNPTLSVSISPSDLVIANLVPGNTLDSNVINVSVASNASYGYTLSAIVNGNNSNLTHSNGTNIFSSIDTNANLSDLEDSEDTNIWGYSYKDNTVQTPTWSNYNGLSSSNSTMLINTNSNISSNLDFKIAAKSSNTQAGGTYTGTINFTAVSNPTPINLSESYFAAGKTRHNGYYVMQDMTTEICNNTEVIDEGSQTQLIDLRDDKVYWATKLKDGHCWMTQNLDLDLSHDRPLNSNDTDLNDKSLNGAYKLDYSYDASTNIISWRPANDTVNFSSTNIVWTTSNDVTVSANKIDDTSSGHGATGNYYNWPAAIASSNSASFSDTNANNSICPKGWRLPNTSNDEFATLNTLYNTSSTSSDNGLVTTPLYFVKSGFLAYNSFLYFSTRGNYWSSTIYNDNGAYGLNFSTNGVSPASNYSGYYTVGRYYGFSLRCLAK